MSEHEERESDEPEEQEAAVLPAREAMSIITAGDETTAPEERTEDIPSRDTASQT
jgi:hypothetical protein